MAKTQRLHHEWYSLSSFSRLSERETKDLCLSKVVELAQWLAELEQRIIELSAEVERLRLLIIKTGAELGLE